MAFFIVDHRRKLWIYDAAREGGDVARDETERK